MLNNAAIISVGAGYNQLPLIQHLAELDIPVVGFDRNPDAPGKRLCTYFNAISTWDSVKAIEWLSNLGVSFAGVGCFSYANALVTQQKIANYFALPGALPDNTIRMNENKTKLRQSLRQAGLSSLKEWSLGELTQEGADYIQPDKLYIVKPCVGGSSNDVRKLEGIAVIQLLNTGELDLTTIVQEFVYGPEFRLVAMIEDNCIPFISVMKKENHPGTCVTGRLIPAPEREDWGRSIIHSLSDRFSLKRTVLKIEVIEGLESDEIIEMDFGIPGDYFESHFAIFAYEFNYVEQYIGLITGKKVPKHYSAVREKACFDYLYWIGEDAPAIRNQAILENLQKHLGAVTQVVTRSDGSKAQKPVSNLDNVTAIMHQRLDIVHSDICSLLVPVLRQ